MDQIRNENLPLPGGAADRIAMTNLPHGGPAEHMAGPAPCPTCGGGATTGPSSFIYAIGRVEARFPRLSVEKEFAQALGRAETSGQTDAQAFHSALMRPENRYLTRQLCWVMTVHGIEAYILYPRDPGDFDRLVEAVRPRPNPADIDVVVGVRGPNAPPEICNGLMVPVVVFDQIYSFDRPALINAIPRPAETSDEQFRAAAEEVFDRIMQLTDNAGATDEHRAFNYLAMRYPAIYNTAISEFARDFALTGVEARPSALSGTRQVMEAIFSFTHRKNDFVAKFSVRVDVTEEFPFLVTRMLPYIDR